MVADEIPESYADGVTGCAGGRVAVPGFVNRFVEQRFGIGENADSAGYGFGGLRKLLVDAWQDDVAQPVTRHVVD